MTHIAGPPLNRRTFLRGAGITLALPFLDAMRPVFGAAAKAAAAESAVPRRMVCIQTNQGIMPQFFFPEKAGRDFALTPYLEKLAAHRSQITVFSGVSLPGVTGGTRRKSASSPALRTRNRTASATRSRSTSMPPSKSAI